MERIIRPQFIIIQQFVGENFGCLCVPFADFVQFLAIGLIFIFITIIFLLVLFKYFVVTKWAPPK
jgi:hypothetical protein